MEELTLITPIGPERAAEVVGILKGAWWADARTAEDVERMLLASPITVGLYSERLGGLVAFGRALTDGVYKALLLDLVVSEPYRGRGVGHRLIEALISHPLLSAVEDVELFCNPQHVGLYSSFGFSVPGGTVFMRRRFAGTKG